MDGVEQGGSLSLTTKQSVKIRAKVYPGMFEGEYEVAVNITGDDIYLAAGPDSVEVTEPPNAQGVDGFLKVDIVGKAGDDKFWIALPGEVRGAPSRIAAERDVITRVA